MPYESVLAIDLGASYTKVALRKEQLQPNAKILYTDWVEQVPSLVIQIGSKWYFGEEAMLLSHDKSWIVYSNWKETLYLKVPASGYGQASIVAYKFFEWLLDWLKKKGVNPAAQRVRICVPAFEDISSYKSTVAQSMQMAGWPTGIQFDSATEPRANTVGILSGGRNCLLKTHSLGYGQMFPQDGIYKIEFDHCFRDQRGPMLKICILDVGSFTSDLACIQINLKDVESDGVNVGSPKSWLHGIINGLDLAVLKKLCTAKGVDWDRIRFTEKEQIKENLYGLGSYTYATGQHLGSSSDHQVIIHGLDNFCADLWMKIEPEVATFKPEFCWLTGGGCQIAGVQTRLKKHFEGLMCKVITVPIADSHYKPHRTERIATVLGAASAILDDPAAAPPSFTPPIAALTSEDIACRCQGANKDCCFCSGRGFYRKA